MKAVIEQVTDKWGQDRFYCLGYYFFSYQDAVDFWKKENKIYTYGK